MIASSSAHRSSRLALRPSMLVAALGLLVSAGAVQAQESPYFLSAKQTFTRDNNIGRRESVARIGDTISATGLQAGFDQPFGQQRISLTADLATNRYASRDFLNYTSYGLTGRLDWATIENISGTASVSTNQGATTIPVVTSNGVGVSSTLVKNIQRVNGYTFDVRKGNVTLLTVDAGISGSQISYSDVSASARNLKQQTFTTGVKLQASPILSGRVGIRHTTGEYPNYITSGGVTGNSIRRNDIDLSSNYELSGLSSLNGRISFTRESQGVGASTNGLTGAFGWNWTPTGRLSLSTTMGRDTRVGALQQFGAVNILNTSTDAQIRDYINIHGTWELTAFVKLDGGVGYSRRTVDSSNSTIANPVNGKDHTTNLNLSMTYTPLRNVVLGCGLSLENRGVDSLNPTVNNSITWGYSDTTVNCYGQAYLR